MEYKIIPIFNQAAPDIWERFMQIRANAMRGAYGIVIKPDDYTRYLQEYADGYTKSTFAFGAFNNRNNMIGFVRAGTHQHLAKIDDLYVVSTYRGKHIGRSLLHAAEQVVASLGIRYIELKAQIGAESFYSADKVGYSYNVFEPGRNNFSKKITFSGCQAVPVFNFTKKIQKLCDGVTVPKSTKYDVAIVAQMVNKNKYPMFMYADVSKTVRGFIIGNDDMGGVYNLSVCDSNVAYNTLRRAIEHHASVHNKSR